MADEFVGYQNRASRAEESIPPFLQQLQGIPIVATRLCLPARIFCKPRRSSDLRFVVRWFVSHVFRASGLLARALLLDQSATNAAKCRLRTWNPRIRSSSKEADVTDTPHRIGPPAIAGQRSITMHKGPRLGRVALDPFPANFLPAWTGPQGASRSPCGPFSFLAPKTVVVVGRKMEQVRHWQSAGPPFLGYFHR
jgi:hypothetical protein